MMVEFHDLTKDLKVSRPRKRVGRGSSAGGGTTAGRGTKGQKARSGGRIPSRFEGGQTPFSQRIPQKRGFRRQPQIVWRVINLDRLEKIAEGETLTLSFFRRKGFLKKSNERIKILGEGQLIKALQIEAHAASRSAREKIERAGGRLMLVNPVRD